MSSLPHPYGGEHNSYNSSYLKVICQENCKSVNFQCSDKANHSAENRDKNLGPFKSYVNLFHAEAFLVHELPPLVFKRFSTTMYYSVMTKMILTFIINIFQTLIINL